MMIDNVTLNTSSSLGGNIILYNISCTLLNANNITLNSTFDSLNNDIILNVNNISAVCKGHYNYVISIFGTSKVIDDTWNLTVTQATESIYIGLRT